jgi:hypothetical protein
MEPALQLIWRYLSQLVHLVARRLVAMHRPNVLRLALSLTKKPLRTLSRRMLPSVAEALSSSASLISTIGISFP